jgi:hypothetical protein
MKGRPIAHRAHQQAGVVLSQPPISTAPSTGWLRSSSSVVHRQEVAVEHGGGLDQALRQRHRRQLEREAAGLQHAALHVVHALLEVHVAGLASLQVLRMAMTGLPAQSAGA